MTNKIPLKKTVEVLLEKIEILENQSFTQKLIIDELESKLSALEERVSRSLEYTSPYPPLLPQLAPQPCQNHLWPQYPDSSGNSCCTACGKLLGTTRIITTTTISSGKIQTQDSQDITWYKPDDSLKYI